MSRLASVAGVITVVVATSAAAAQSKPDFSGTWILVPIPVNGGGASVVRAQPAVERFEIVQTDKTLTQIWMFSDVQVKRVFNLDGLPSTNAIQSSNGFASVGDSSTARWEGRKLRIEMTEAGQTSKSTELWSIDAAGQLTVERASTVVPSRVVTATYRKQ